MLSKLDYLTLLKKRLNYDIIRFQFIESGFLFHHDHKKPVYASVDFSQIYDHETVLYHVENDFDVESIMKNGKIMQFFRNKIQFILFLSKLLSIVESKY